MHLPFPQILARHKEGYIMSMKLPVIAALDALLIPAPFGMRAGWPK
jgi:hypothetical protein